MATKIAGLISTDLNSFEGGRSVILQTDGKIIVVGETSVWRNDIWENDFVVMRYNKNGSLDTSFGDGGIVTTDFGHSNEHSGARSVALQSDGKIVVAGGTTPISESKDSNTKSHLTLVRYNVDGSLDTSFGNNGKIINPIASFYDVDEMPAQFPIAIQSDGKILVAGMLYDENASNYAYYSQYITRYNSDGSLDLSFGNNGSITTSNAGAQSIALQSDGKFLVTGWSGSLIRYNPDGTQDFNFGNNGVVSDSNSSILTMQQDRKIVVAGTIYNPAHESDLLLKRYNHDGTLDITFGNQGLVVTDWGFRLDSVSSISEQSDGKIVFVGIAYTETKGWSREIVAARYNKDGSLDNSFGTNGKIEGNWYAYDYAYSSLVQPDGSILIAGEAGYDYSGSTGKGSDLGGYDFLLAKYNKDGSLDKSFTGKNVDNVTVTQHPYTGNVLIIGNAIQDETLSIQNTLNDADGLGTLNYQWLQNGKAISGATKATYTLSESDIGTAITAKVSYTDGLKKLESVTSGATDLIEPKPEEILPPTYTLTIDKTSVNEGDTVTFKLVTENVAADTEIPFNFGGSISNADVLGGLKTKSFTVDASGKASLGVKFLADKFTDGKTENLTLTLNSGESQSVAVKDTSVPPAPVVIIKPIEVVPVVEEPAVIVKPVTGNASTGTVKVDGKTLTAKSNAKDLLIGGEKNDSLTGRAGADTLRGNAGNDYLDGGLGNDFIDAGNGNDTLIGSEGNDLLNAGSGDDKLDGGKDNDTLDGGAGNDTLIGGANVDSMTGGTGDDFYVVDNIKDKAIETDSNPTIGGKDTVTSNSPTYTLGENIENLILEDLQGKGTSGAGNKGNNVITGSVGDNKLEGLVGNDTLMAGEGADTLDGGVGMDSLVGGNGDDLYIMQNIDDIIDEKLDGGIDHIIASVTFNLGQSENVEWLTLSGKNAIDGTGNELDNLLQEKVGGTTNNSLSGGAGNDMLNGEGGDDTLNGGDGDDELNGGDGQDVAIFTGDYLDYLITTNTDAAGVPQLVVEYKNSETGILDGIDILNDIEILEFAYGNQHNKADVLNDIGAIEVNSSAALIITGTIL